MEGPPGRSQYIPLPRGHGDAGLLPSSRVALTRPVLTGRSEEPQGPEVEKPTERLPEPKTKACSHGSQASPELKQSARRHHRHNRLPHLAAHQYISLGVPFANPLT